jgi:cob(I)alamin adenosyltransferase
MAAEKFDIFEQYDNLIASGIPAEQARAQLNVLKDTLSTIVQNMATKEDIKSLAVATKEDIKRLEKLLK